MAHYNYVWLCLVCFPHVLPKSGTQLASLDFSPQSHSGHLRAGVKPAFIDFTPSLASRTYGLGDLSENPEGRVTLPSAPSLLPSLPSSCSTRVRFYAKKCTHFSTFLPPYDHPRIPLGCCLALPCFSRTNLAPSALRCSQLRVPHHPGAALCFLAAMSHMNQAHGNLRTSPPSLCLLQQGLPRACHRQAQLETWACNMTPLKAS